MTDTKAKPPVAAGDRRRHVFIWGLLYFLLGGLLRRVFRLHLDPLPRDAAPRLILCNHPTMLDPLFLGLCSRRQFYFLASEALSQRGLRSWLMNRYLAPVVKQKGAVAAGAAVRVLRLLRAGCSVCIFPEGIATANGQTQPIIPSTGKLARSAGATLVTYRFEGAYLSRPKWGRPRRGPVYGRLAGEYAPETLRAMTAEEVNALIARDLYQDDYAWQREKRIPYPCRRGVAQGLENVLYLCPACGALGTLRAGGRRLWCACGLETELDDFGFFQNAPYETVLDWDLWQTAELKRRLSGGQALTLENEGATLYAVSGHRPRPLGTGTLRMDRHSLEAAGRSFPLREVSGFAIHGRNYFVFFVGDAHYEVKTLKTRAQYSAYPYLLLLEAAREQPAPTGDAVPAGAGAS